MSHALTFRLSYSEARDTLINALRANLAARDRYVRWQLPSVAKHHRVLARNNIRLIRELDRLEVARHGSPAR